MENVAKQPQPKKSYKKLIIILIIIIVLLAAVMAITGILLLSRENEGKGNKSTTPLKSTETIKVEEAILHKNRVALQLFTLNNNAFFDDFKAVSIAFNVINNNNYVILPAFTDLVINGKSITDTKMIININADENATYGIPKYTESGVILYISKDSLEKLSITEIDTISFGFVVTNETSWKKNEIFPKETINLTKDQLKYNNSTDISEKLVFDKNNVKLYSARFSENDVRLYVENNTSKNIEIAAFDIYIDDEYQSGYILDRVYDFWSLTLPAGEKKYSKLFTTESYLYTPSTIRILKARYIVFEVTSTGKTELFRTDPLEAYF